MALSLAETMRWIQLAVLTYSAAEALHLATPVPRVSAGTASKPRVATISMRLDVIPLVDSRAPGFLATRFILPAVVGSVIGGACVRRSMAKLVVGALSLLLTAILCVPQS